MPLLVIVVPPAVMELIVSPPEVPKRFPAVTFDSANLTVPGVRRSGGHPWSRHGGCGGTVHDARNRGRRVRIFAVRQVVVVGERHGRDHRRVHVGGEAGHERRLVAEVAVRRVVRGVGDLIGKIGGHDHVRALDELTRGIGLGDRARIVHAGNRHLRHITGRVRRIHAVASRSTGRCRRPTGRNKHEPLPSPLKSRMATGRLGGPNFSPNCGENGSNSEAKSSVIPPVK